jgi:hypothetical protein
VFPVAVIEAEVVEEVEAEDEAADFFDLQAVTAKVLISRAKMYFFIDHFIKIKTLMQVPFHE